MLRAWQEKLKSFARCPRRVLAGGHWLPPCFGNLKAVFRVLYPALPSHGTRRVTMPHVMTRRRGPITLQPGEVTGTYCAHKPMQFQTALYTVSGER